MSFMWTLVATFLYAEIGAVVLLLLPLISCSRWRNILQSRSVQAVSQYANFYFLILVVVLILLFADAVREIMKYSKNDIEMNPQSTPGAMDHMHMKLFRAQRNCYISGFALFLWFVLRRLVKLVLSVATLQAESEAALKQAAGATAAAQAMLDANDTEQNDDGTAEELGELKGKHKETVAELEKEKKNVTAMKQQAEATNREYDRLAEECQKLQNRLQRESSGDKKDE